MWNFTDVTLLLFPLLTGSKSNPISDIKMEDRSVVKAMANASKKVEKMKNRDIM